MNIGEYIKQYREALNLTRKEFSIGLCSIVQIRRIENGECEPSIFLLDKISHKYNIDFYKFYKDLTYFKDVKYKGICEEMSLLIKQNKISELNSICINLESDNNFHNGILYAYLTYWKAVYTNDENLHNETIDICMKYLKKEYPNFNIENIGNKIFLDMEYAIINLLGNSYIYIGSYDLASAVINNAILSLETFYYNNDTSFYHSQELLNNIYIALKYQLGKLNYHLSNYESSNVKLNECLAISLKLNCSKLLATIHRIKLYNYCELHKFDEAKNSYIIAKELYLRTNRKDLADSMYKFTRTNYPNLKI